MARLCALAVGALAPAPLPIRQAVSAVAANERGAIALTGDEVRIMDATGCAVARLPRAAVPLPLPRRAARRASGFAAAAGVLDDGDFNDPHDPDSEVEDPENILVEDDAPAHHRPRSSGGPAAVAVAVGGAFAWLGREDGLWRIPFLGNAERAALPAGGPVRAVAVSRNGQVVVAALEDGLVWSNDGGARFERIAFAPSRVTRLAVTDSGRIYALGREGLHQLAAGAALPDVLVSEANDVIACGNAALALAHHRISVLGEAASGAPETHEATPAPEAGPPVPPGAERLACGPDGKVWIAYGAALWISADQGQSWIPRDQLPAFAMAAVAVTRSSLWVASDAGLAVLPLRPETGPLPDRSVSASPAVGAGVPPRPRWRWWLAAFPNVELGFATARSNARREVRAFVLLTFTFEPRRPTRGERQLDAEARAAEMRDEAQRWLTWDAGPGEHLDPIAAEERDATLRLLDD